MEQMRSYRGDRAVIDSMVIRIRQSARRLSIRKGGGVFRPLLECLTKTEQHGRIEDLLENHNPAFCNQLGDFRQRTIRGDRAILQKALDGDRRDEVSSISVALALGHWGCTQ